MTTPVGQRDIVRRLVGEQSPEWRTLSISPVASQSTANAIFRVGGELVARFPLTSDYAETTRRQVEEIAPRVARAELQRS